MPRIVRVEVGSFSLLRSLFVDQGPGGFREAGQLYGVPIHETKKLTASIATVVYGDGSFVSLNIAQDVIEDGVTRTPLERLTKIFAESWEAL